MPKNTITAWGLSAMMVIALFFFTGNGGAAAAKLADGTYEVDYTVKKPDDESVSISNDYFEKPARVEVRNGEAVVYFQTNHNKWITSLKYPAGPDGVELQAMDANEDEDTKVFLLPHKDVLVPAALAVHVKIDELGYDHAYTVRLVFKTDHLPLLDESTPVAEKGSKPEGSAAGSGGKAESDGSAKEAAQNEAAKADSKPQESPAADSRPQESSGTEPKGQEPSAAAPERQEQGASGTEEAAQPKESAQAKESAKPEGSAGNDAPAASGGGTLAQDASNAAESGLQAADRKTADSSEHAASGRSIWFVALLVVLAGCALAAIGLAYRRQRRKRQAHS